MSTWVILIALAAVLALAVLLFAVYAGHPGLDDTEREARKPKLH